MLKKALAAVLGSVLILAVSSVSVFAADPETSKATSAPAKTEKKSDQKLKADMSKLVDDARAGKVAPKPQHFPNTHRNNLSTGAKIGIIAGIGAAIFLIIMFHQINDD